MPIICRVNENIGVVSVSGRFNFDLHRPFRDATTQLLDTPGIVGIDINLCETDYIDSSALGMLLVLREQANNKGIITLSISGATGSVRKVLAMARFEKFFTLD